MKLGTRVTDAQLNALLDGELSDTEAARLRAAIAAQPQARQRLEELRRVQNATRAILIAPKPRAPQPVSRPYRAVAAIAIAAVTLGAGAGWWARGPASLGVQVSGARIATTASQTPSPQILLHIAHGDPDKLTASLQQVEALLTSKRTDGKAVQLEVLVNGGALLAVMADASPVATRIAHLQRDYPNLRFVACRQTIERYRLERGAEPKLVPGVTVASSALEQVVYRLGQGWTYVRI